MAVRLPSWREVPKAVHTVVASPSNTTRSPDPVTSPKEARLRSCRAEGNNSTYRYANLVLISGFFLLLYTLIQNFGGDGLSHFLLRFEIDKYGLNYANRICCMVWVVVEGLSLKWVVWIAPTEFAVWLEPKMTGLNNTDQIYRMVWVWKRWFELNHLVLQGKK